MGGAFRTGYAVWMYWTWLPADLAMRQHISIGKTRFPAMIMLIFSALGALAGGWVTDRFAPGRGRVGAAAGVRCHHRLLSGWSHRISWPSTIILRAGPRRSLFRVAKWDM
jgi:hypothetical protein